MRDNPLMLLFQTTLSLFCVLSVLFIFADLYIHLLLCMVLNSMPLLWLLVFMLATISFPSWYLVLNVSRHQNPWLFSLVMSQWKPFHPARSQIPRSRPQMGNYRRQFPIVSLGIILCSYGQGFGCTPHLQETAMTVCTVLAAESVVETDGPCPSHTGITDSTKATGPFSHLHNGSTF